MTWKRISDTLIGHEQKTGTVSVFFDYDLMCWLIGLSLNNDEYWIDFKLSLGPIGLSIVYWRKHTKR